MQEKNSVVEEALIQMKQIEEAISENAKGILASTMKEEINQLVKESLSEQDDEEETTDVDMDTEMDMDTDNEEEMDMDTEMDVDDEDMDTDMEMDMDMDSEETPIDLTHASDEEILKVFKAMGEDDGIIVKKDGTNVTLKDNTTDSEYLVKLGESKSKRKINEMYEEESDIDSVIESLFSDSEQNKEEMEEAMYEIHMDEQEDDDDDESEIPMGGMDEIVYEIQMDEQEDDDDDESEMPDMDETMYEGMYGDSPEMEEGMYGDSPEMEETMYEIEMDEEMDEESEEYESYHMDESYSHKKAKKGMKPKGVGMGSPKFSYKKSTGGFKEDMKQGTRGVGMGKAKFEYKEGKNMDGKSKIVKKTETKEAARTYGMGSKEGRGLRKGITPNRNLKMESLEAEVSMLREKNEEYRKALNTFREKLNEVATFNSNLAYATRLFTEHSTTKKEKINILRRFDEVETLKESKNLYKSIKEELTKVESKPMNESVETKMNKNVSTGSSTTLIESKTYENPQFLRIKDLMNKM
jgi:hypothetical protein